MLTLKELTSNYTAFSSICIKFKSQNEVLYCLSQTVYKRRFSKADLIGCIKFYLGRISLFTDINKIKHGFVLDKFKYHELSVYLHGLLQVYCSLADFAPVGELFIKRFSHLPHDVMVPEKDSIGIECALLHSPHGTPYYVGFTDQLVFATSFERFKELANKTPLARKYNFIFNLK